MRSRIRRICYVTGTRAEFGLMRSTLDALRRHPNIQLQLVVTGMHLWPTHGRTIDAIRAQGWKVDEVVDWPVGNVAAATGMAMGGLAGACVRLAPDVVLICGDRVEAFAAASAAHLAGHFVAHVHGGDRAQGQADDALRHAITKLSHFHFAATQQSRERILKLGEQAENTFLVGTPGLDGITMDAADPGEVGRITGVAAGQFALLVLHPTIDDGDVEYQNARQLAAAVLEAGVPRLVIVRPNNDPGHEGINRCWDELTSDARIVVHTDIARPAFLGLLRDAAFLAGNSSSGIIEAATFGTPVIDIGPRQAGRERSGNVQHASTAAELSQRLEQAWNQGRPRRWHGRNVYGEGGAGERITGHLASVSLEKSAQGKLIVY